MPARASPRRSGISLTYRISATSRAIGMRRDERLPGQRAAGLHDVRAQQHQRSETDRDGDLAEAAIDELQRRRGVAEADDEPDHADDQQRRRAVGREQDQPDDAGERRRRGSRSSPSGAGDTSPYWMTREPPLNWVGVTLASSAPWTVSKTSLATLSPSWTNDAPRIVRTAANRSKDPWLAAIGDAEDDRDDRRGQERQAGRRAGSANRERQAGLDRRPALG